LFFNRIDILSTAPCVIVPNRIRFRARLSDDIQGILPYLKGLIKNAVYSHEGKVLSFQKDDRLITVYRTEVTVAKAMDERDAQEIVAWFTQLLQRYFCKF
jgi:ArsR family metal-binding transcriptional regulator